MPPKSSGGFCVENLRSSIVWQVEAQKEQSKWTALFYAVL